MHPSHVSPVTCGAAGVQSAVKTRPSKASRAEEKLDAWLQAEMSKLAPRPDDHAALRPRPTAGWFERSL